MNGPILVDERIKQFLEYEADLLDHKDYESWLKIWNRDGLYIVPVDHNATDFKNAVNVAYDDDQMRKERVRRLSSGEAVSTHNSQPTVRTLSRFRVLEKSDEKVVIRCAYCLYENNKNGVRHFPANLEYTLNVSANGYSIQQKIVRIMKSEEHLTTVSFLF